MTDPTPKQPPAPAGSRHTLWDAIFELRNVTANSMSHPSVMQEREDKAAEREAVATIDSFIADYEARLAALTAERDAAMADLAVAKTDLLAARAAQREAEAAWDTERRRAIAAELERNLARDLGMAEYANGLRLAARAVRVAGERDAARAVLRAVNEIATHGHPSTPHGRSCNDCDHISDLCDAALSAPSATRCPRCGALWALKTASDAHRCAMGEAPADRVDERDGLAPRNQDEK